MEIQAALGSEIVMVLDECPKGDAGHAETKKSLEMTARWAKRSKDRFNELQDLGMDTGFLEMKQRMRMKFHGIADPRSFDGTASLIWNTSRGGHLDLRRESLEKTDRNWF